MPARDLLSTTTPTPAPELLSIREGGAVLHVSTRTVARLIRSGELRSLTIGTRRLISRAAIDDYIRERESATQAGGAA